MLGICTGCGQGFMGVGATCDRCEAQADPLVCRECRTTLLVAVPGGLCGICDPEWTEHLAVAA